MALTTKKAAVLSEPVIEPKGDPIVRFSESIRAAAVPLDTRTPEQLEHEGRWDPDPVNREQALYQLLERRGADALPVIERALMEDTDRDVRVNLLWALEDVPDPRCRAITLGLVADRDSHVQEWARVFAWEKGWTAEDFRRADRATSHPGRTFDQTIYLHINCHLHIRMSPANDAWGHIRLSPQMLARVYGQALACPNVATRDHRIVISKTLCGLHEDGTKHYEAFLFRGFTERTRPDRGNFYFEANTPRPFYLSGRAVDMSEGVIENVPIPFAREGQWFLNDNLTIDGVPAIEYVRGLFQGWAFVNLERIEKTDGQFLFPGNSVLSTLHHPVIGPLTNAFFTGSFKGKVLDWDGDGVLDLNYLPSYATVDGEVDSDLDGRPDVPGMTMSRPRPAAPII
jgi:hypothetical protein